VLLSSSGGHFSMFSCYFLKLLSAGARGFGWTVADLPTNEEKKQHTKHKIKADESN
jgi:hypothetical protein